MSETYRVLDFYGISYRESSRWQSLKCLSPSHEDRRASARLNLEEEAYFCNGCGAKAGNVLQIIAIIEGPSVSPETRYAQITGSSYRKLSETTGKRRRIDLNGETKGYERGSELLRRRVRKTLEPEDD